MTLGYTVKKGIFILNEDCNYDSVEKNNFSKKDSVISGDYTMVRSLSEKAQSKMEKKRRKEEKRKSENVDMCKEVKDNAELPRAGKQIDYSQAVGRKDYFGSLYKEVQKPSQEETDEIVFDLHKRVVVDYDQYNLKEIIDFTLNVLDNILNNSKIPSLLKTIVNNSLQAIIRAFSISSIGKWITFLASVKKILAMVTDNSEEIKTFVDRIEDLTKVSENCYKDCDTIRDIYSKAFGDLADWADSKTPEESKYIIKKFLRKI